MLEVCYSGGYLEKERGETLQEVKSQGERQKSNTCGAKQTRRRRREIRKQTFFYIGYKKTNPKQRRIIRGVKQAARDLGEREV
jgi:hypothetical protein